MALGFFSYQNSWQNFAPIYNKIANKTKVFLFNSNGGLSYNSFFTNF